MTVAAMSPNKCGVLYSRIEKNGKTKYYFTGYQKDLKAAQKIADDRLNNKYSKTRILEVDCSPTAKELQADGGIPVTCPSGKTVMLIG